MSESDSQTVLILLYSTLGVLAVLLGMLAGIRRRISRIERHLWIHFERQDEPGGAPGSAETSPGGAFETFLREDPARRELPKAEQFAEYRKWRQEKGLNWSNS